METTHNRPPLMELNRQKWDLLVIGGGITGAGVFQEATRIGLKTLLVERGDFASGTSSHSAKLIHGGLHYLARLQVGLARKSIRERDSLLQDGSGLIEPIDFILPLLDGERFRACVTTVGLGLYQTISGKYYRPSHVSEKDLARIAPGLDQRYRDALRHTEGQTDDARLTLRVIAEGRRDGGTARNYTAATTVTRDRHGKVTGGLLHDEVSGETATVGARCIVNAAGPWSDHVRAWIGRPVRQRLVAGSHLVFPHERLPVETAMAAYHPESGRPLYLAPWRGVTIVGTTHIDSGTSVDRPARATMEETCYLLNGVQSVFPELHLTIDDLQATFSGYRPIVDTHTRDPSRASRDYGIWVEDGMITVTGGKLTTYRSVAKQVLRKVAPRIGSWVDFRPRESAFDTICDEITDVTCPGPEMRRLAAKYGPAAVMAMMEMPAEEQLPLPGSGGITLAEIRWAALAEDVVHLDDLLFRRVRLALLAPEGGAPLLHQIEPIAREELGWDLARWLSEVDRYRELWSALYAVPGQVAAPTQVELDTVSARRDQTIELVVGGSLGPERIDEGRRRRKSFVR